MNASEAPISGPAGEVPAVSLGLPVYNGENYLRQALDSVLGQTFRDWELILSDNGSDDATESLCLEYARSDARIRYYRESRNRGATWNFNRVFALARAPLFRWTAHDDLCQPRLLEALVAAMRGHPEAVLCHSLTRVIGPEGETLYEDPVRLRTASLRPSERFHDLICLNHSCYQIFGLIRCDALRRTRLLGDYVGTDRNLLAELALMAPFHEVPETLFLRRDHPRTSTRQFPHAGQRLAWFRANGGATRFTTWRRAQEYGLSMMRVPLDAEERTACLGHLLKWTGQRARSFMAGAISGRGFFPEGRAAPINTAASIRR